MTEHPATIDFETFSVAGFRWDAEAGKWKCLPGAPQNKKGLGVVGSAVYAEHPSTIILTLSYFIPGWPGVARWRPGQPLPQALFDWIANGGLIEAHNVMFERLIWHFVATRLYNFPPLPPQQLRCSMATARVNNLPGGLGELGDVLQLDTRKDKDGKRLLRKFSFPRDPTKADRRLWIRPEDDPEDGEKLFDYCDSDVLTEIAASDRMDPMTSAELEFWLVDQEINWRGLAIDRKGVRDCIAILNQAIERYGAEYQIITGGLNPTQLEATKGWLAARGVRTSSLDADAVAGLLARKTPVLAPDVRRVLEIRDLIGSASVKKLFAMDLTASNDNRIRNLIVHHGARTGRPTGEGAQPLNMPKEGPKLVTCGPCAKPYHPKNTVCPWCGSPKPADAKSKWSPEMADPVLAIMAVRNLDLVEYFFGDAVLAIMGCVRSLFTGGEDRGDEGERIDLELIASDYSAIEAVVIAMLAGEQWRIDAFLNNEDIYLVGASKITGRSLAEYEQYHRDHGDKHPDRQQIGKISELACFTAQTQVLTKRGYVALVDVRIDDLLWDGVEWVKHAGLIAKGKRGVLKLDGVETTPNHLINCGGFWKAASQLDSNPDLLRRALASGSANLPRRGAWPIPPATEASRSSALAADRPISSHFLTSAKEKARAAIGALRRKAGQLASITTATPTLCRTSKTGFGCSGVSRLASPVAVRMATRITADVAFAFTPNGQTGRRDDAIFWPILSRLTGGTTRLWNWTESTLTGITSRAICGLSRGLSTMQINARFPKCRGGSPSLKPVYDIAYAGPRNRFTIKTDTGHLLVHNCGFGGWIAAYRAFGWEGMDEDAKAQIIAWRDASPAIVELWGGQWRGKPWDGYAERYGFEGAAVNAIQYPGTIPEVNGIKFERRIKGPDDWLVITLLSGRELKYHNPFLEDSTRPYASPGEQQIWYWTENKNPKYGPLGWVTMQTFGGRLTENIVQAIAHDILRYAILNLRLAGYPTVLHVYDEIVVEVRTRPLTPVGLPDPQIFEVERIMSTMPPWAAGWPVRASGGWRGKRYRKA